jgi:hypothetical protein
MTARARATAIRDARYRAAEAARARSTPASDCGIAIADTVAISVTANSSSSRL